MTKPKKWDTMTPEEQEAWRERKLEKDRKYREANIEKIRERNRKRYEANIGKFRKKNRKYREAYLQQSAADQFFVMAGAAKQLSKAVSYGQT